MDGGGSISKGISQEKVKVHLSTSSIRHRLLCHREIIASVGEMESLHGSLRHGLFGERQGGSVAYQQCSLSDLLGRPCESVMDIWLHP